MPVHKESSIQNTRFPEDKGSGTRSEVLSLTNLQSGESTFTHTRLFQVRKSQQAKLNRMYQRCSVSTCATHFGSIYRPFTTSSCSGHSCRYLIPGHDSCLATRLKGRNRTRRRTTSDFGHCDIEQCMIVRHLAKKNSGSPRPMALRQPLPNHRAASFP